jgi:hypothetical protein
MSRGLEISPDKPFNCLDKSSARCSPIWPVVSLSIHVVKLQDSLSFYVRVWVPVSYMGAPGPFEIRLDRVDVYE